MSQRKPAAALATCLRPPPCPPDRRRIRRLHGEAPSCSLLRPPPPWCSTPTRGPASRRRLRPMAAAALRHGRRHSRAHRSPRSRSHILPSRPAQVRREHGAGPDPLSPGPGQSEKASWQLKAPAEPDGSSELGQARRAPPDPRAHPSPQLSSSRPQARRRHGPCQPSVGAPASPSPPPPPLPTSDQLQIFPEPRRDAD
jgi:hypothetical protein